MKQKLILFLIIGFINLFYLNYLFAGGYNILGDITDGRFNLYILEHIYLYFIGIVDTVNPPIFFPAEDTLYYSDNHFFNAILYIPIRLIGVDKYSAYQIWMSIIFVLNFISFYWVSRKLELVVISAIAGSIIFTYSLPVMMQTLHMQLHPRFFIPLAFLFLFNFLKEGGVKTFSLAIIMVLMQLIVGIYTGLFLVLLLAIYLLFNIYKIFPALKKTYLDLCYNKDTYYLLVLVGLISLTITIYYPYYLSKNEFGYRSWAEIEKLLPTLESLRYVPPYAVNWQNIYTIKSWELVSFPGGIPILALLIFPLFLFIKEARKKSWILFVILTIALSVLVTIKYNGHSFYENLYNLPGFGAIRVVSRIIGVQIFFFAIVVAGTIHIMLLYLKNVNKFVAIFTGVFLLFLVYKDQEINWLFTIKKKELLQTELVWTEKLKKKLSECDVFVLSALDSKRGYWETHLDAMYISQILDIPTLNGYSGRLPHHYRMESPKIHVNRLYNWLIYNYKNDRLKDLDLKIGIIDAKGERPYTTFNTRIITLKEVLLKEKINNFYLYFLGREVKYKELRAFTINTLNKDIIKYFIEKHSKELTKRLESTTINHSLNRIYSLMLDSIPPKETVDRHLKQLQEDNGIFFVLKEIVENYGNSYSNRYLIKDINSISKGIIEN